MSFAGELCPLQPPVEASLKSSAMVVVTGCDWYVIVLSPSGDVITQRLFCPFQRIEGVEAVVNQLVVFDHIIIAPCNLLPMNPSPTSRQSVSAGS